MSSSVVAPTAASGPLFAMLGGSNSLGAKNVKYEPGTHKSFGRLFGHKLKQERERAGKTTSTLSGAIGALGPSFAAACLSRFLPPSVMVATIEYLPNMGYLQEDDQELQAIEALLRAMHERGGRAFLVDILPGDGRYDVKGCKEHMKGCASRKQVESLRDATLSLAQRWGAQSIVMDANLNRSFFESDVTHLTQEGHRLVSSRLWDLYKSSPPAALAPTSGGAKGTTQKGLMCHLGQELEPLVARAHKFARTDISRDGSGKIGWEAREPGAELELCLSLPWEAARSIAAQRKTLEYRNKRERNQEQSEALYKKFTMAVGLQASHPLNPPLVGVARVRCRGGCHCKCYHSEHKP